MSGRTGRVEGAFVYMSFKSDVGTATVSLSPLSSETWRGVGSVGQEVALSFCLPFFTTRLIANDTAREAILL